MASRMLEIDRLIADLRSERMALAASEKARTESIEELLQNNILIRAVCLPCQGRGSVMQMSAADNADFDEVDCGLCQGLGWRLQAVWPSGEEFVEFAEENFDG